MNSNTFTLGTGASVVVVVVVVVSCPKHRCDVITVVKRKKVAAAQDIVAVLPENAYLRIFVAFAHIYHV